MFECTPQHGKQGPTFFPRATVPAGLLKKGFFTDLPGNVQEQLGMVPTLSREAVKEEERETVAREAAQDDEREAAKEERREEEGGVALPMQTKLRVSSPDDPTEREADEMADRMMTMPLQREVVGRETVDPEPETVAPKASPGWASPEAIRTGGALRLGGASVVGREAAKEEEREGVSREASEDALQTKCADCEAEEKDTLSRQETPEEDTVAAKLQRKVDMSGATVDAGTAAQINSVRRSGGQPLAKADREYFEERMDADFSNVRVHTNAAANETASAVQARAFTLGGDIVFNQGEYRPETSDGKRLLAHELTHTIQQGSATSKQGGMFAKLARSVGKPWWQVVQRKPRDQDRLGEPAVGHGAVTAYDSSLRVQYAREADDMAHKLLGDYASGKLSHEEAKANAISRRNFLLNQTRLQLSPGGAALSSLIHPPRSQEWLESKYILRILTARPDLQVAAGIVSLDEIDIEKGARFNPEKLRRAVDLAGEELSLRIVRFPGEQIS